MGFIKLATLFLLCLNLCVIHLSHSFQLAKTAHDLSKMAVIYLVDVNKVPVYTQYFDISYIPSTVFFFNGQHMKVDYGYVILAGIIDCICKNYQSFSMLLCLGKVMFENGNVTGICIGNSVESQKDVKLRSILKYALMQ